MEGHLLMSVKERRRKSVFEEVLAGRLTIVAASRQLGLSYRQCRRSYKRFRAQGETQGWCIGAGAWRRTGATRRRSSVGC